MMDYEIKKTYIKEHKNLIEVTIVFRYEGTLFYQEFMMSKIAYKDKEFLKQFYDDTLPRKARRILNETTPF